MDALQYMFALLESVPLVKMVSHKFSMSTRKRGTTVVKEAVRSTSALLKNCSEAGFEFSLIAQRTWRCVSILAPYCYDILDAKETSCIRYEAGRCHS